MNDLVQWLRDQLDEDERIARAAPGPSWEHRQIRGDFDESVVFEHYVAVSDPERNVVVFPDVSAEVLPFALGHDPARVLREIEAKRAIVDDLAEFIRWGARKGLDYQDGVDACERTLKRLALPYADRPGYREEWRP